LATATWVPSGDAATLRVLMPARTSATTFRFHRSNLVIQPSREAKNT
jgi:hypothetical protein